jgi:hypothetical protein
LKENVVPGTQEVVAGKADRLQPRQRAHVLHG